MPNATFEYKQMQLHDGEEQAKNDELAALLKPACSDDINYWEGDNGGVYITLFVREGDTVQASADGWVRVVRATKMPDMVFTEKDM